MNILRSYCKTEATYTCVYPTRREAITCLIVVASLATQGCVGDKSVLPLEPGNTGLSEVFLSSSQDNMEIFDTHPGNYCVHHY